MFIALSTKNTIAPYGGAECYWMSTYQVEFRPSERRRGLIGRWSINIPLLTELKPRCNAEPGLPS
jgi:hypothetical protein